jgi:hypothetical protein
MGFSKNVYKSGNLDFEEIFTQEVYWVAFSPPLPFETAS